MTALVFQSHTTNASITATVYHLATGAQTSLYTGVHRKRHGHGYAVQSVTSCSPGLLFQETPTVVATKHNITLCKFELTLSPFVFGNILPDQRFRKLPPLAQRSPSWTCSEECQPSQLLPSSSRLRGSLMVRQAAIPVRALRPTRCRTSPVQIKMATWTARPSFTTQLTASRLGVSPKTAYTSTRFLATAADLDSSLEVHQAAEILAHSPSPPGTARMNIGKMTTSGLRCQSRVPYPQVQLTCDLIEDPDPTWVPHSPMHHGDLCAKTADTSTRLVTTSTGLVSTMQAHQVAEVLS